jgi:ATP-dependent protease Clp ATPase subunit
VEECSCIFCKKSDKQVAQLLGFPTKMMGLSDDIFICDECVELMVNIIAEQNKDWRNRQIEALTKLNSQSN